MKALLDTHTFLWWNMDDPRLSGKARSIIEDGANEIYFSAASAWEISIKSWRGRLILPEPPGRYISSRLHRNRFRALSVEISHAARVFELPDHHSDPFDRLLIAQSQLESIPLLTAEPQFRSYRVHTIW